MGEIAYQRITFRANSSRRVANDTVRQVNAPGRPIYLAKPHQKERIHARRGKVSRAGVGSVSELNELQAVLTL